MSLRWSQKQSIEFVIDIGTDNGFDDYYIKNFDMDDMVVFWNEAAREAEKDRGIYVSAIISDSRAVYKKEWGCPHFGESIYTIRGTMNKKFIDDRHGYLMTVCRIVEILKKRLLQSTVMMTFREVETFYFNDKQET